MVLPALDLGQGCGVAGGAVHSQEKLISSRRWRGACPKGGSDQTIGIAQAVRKDSKPDRIGVWLPLPSQHRRAIQRIGADAFKGKGGAIKQIECQVIGATRLRIIPQPELRIITYPSGMRRLMLQGVEEPAAADGVAGLRHGDALIEWPAARKPRKSKVADHPAVSNLIVHNKRVTVVLAAARRARQRGKECVVCDRARQAVAVFVINRERDVDRFHVMIRTDIAVAVWRRATAELGCSPPLESQQRGRHSGRRSPEIFEQLLDVREARSAVARRCTCLLSPVRIARQDSLLKLGLRRDVREAAQILVQTDRTNHLYHVRRLCAGRRLVCSGAIVLAAFSLSKHARECAKAQQRQEDAGQDYKQAD
ncbi:MAG: hypothetical protein DME93_08965 [Verrucomicrobia bacterium]|nr:MAG: hypothetical protein DME93_08965 [Verrucomicrobiota bacterium]